MPSRFTKLLDTQISCFSRSFKSKIAISLAGPALSRKVMTTKLGSHGAGHFRSQNKSTSEPHCSFKKITHMALHFPVSVSKNGRSGA